MTRREKYFVKQKLMGLVLIVVTVVASLMMGDITICLLSVPLGLGLIITKDMVWMDDFYYEMEEKRAGRL